MNMPTISKIRLANVMYEQGQKRYHDELFFFDSYNGAILLENGGGKTVFIQSVLQAIIPHTSIAERAIKDTLYLEDGPAHIAIEWIINERPRRYVVTAVTLFKRQNKLDSLRYVYEYGENDAHAISQIPFTKKTVDGTYATTRQEIQEYYSNMAHHYKIQAKVFPQSIKSYTDYIEKHYYIVHEEWENIVRINSAEGGIEKVFEECKKTNELFNRLLIPSVERGIAGYTENAFVDLFENHREQLKKYKELRETIDEYKRLQQALNIYVEQFQKLDAQQRHYTNERMLAKGYYEHLLASLEKLQQQLTSNELALEELQQQQSALSKKQAALRIHEQQELLNDAITAEAEQQNIVDRLQQKLRSWHHDYYSTEYAINREARAEELAALQFNREQLAKENEQHDTADLQNQLEIVKGELHYHFVTKREQYEKHINECSEAITRLIEQRLPLEENLQQLNKQIKANEHQLAGLTREHELKLEDMKNIKLQITANENEQVVDLLAEWKKKAADLEQDNMKLDTSVKKLQDERNEVNEQRDRFMTEQRAAELAHNTIIENLKSIEERETETKEALRQVFPQSNFYQSLYARQNALHMQLTDKIAKLEKEKNNALHKERLAYRYLDDYAKQQQFFAEPYVAEQIAHWNSFSFLQTGIQYIETIKEDIDLGQVNYQLWAITLITTVEEKQVLVDKLTSIRDQLSLPIVVLSTEQANRLAKGEKASQQIIEPALWQNNMEQQHFAEWKQTITEHAKFCSNERKQIEQQVQRVNECYTMFNKFFEKYPATLYQELEVKKSETEHQLQNIKNNLRDVEGRIQYINVAIDKQHKTLQEQKEELQYIQTVQIPAATNYLKLEKHVQHITEQLKIYEKKIATQIKEQQRYEQQLSELTAEIAEVQQSISQINSQIRYEIDEDELYKEVKAFQPRVTSTAEGILKQQYTAISEQLRQISITFGQLQERIQGNLKQIERFEENMEKSQLSCSTLDKERALPMEAKGLLKELHGKIEQGQVDLKKREDTLKQANGLVIKHETLLSSLHEDYQKRFENAEIITFTVSLLQVRMQLQEEQRQWQQRKDFLVKEKGRFQKQLKTYQDNKESFTDSVYQHSLNSPSLHTISLTVEQMNQFDYEQQQILQKLTKDLGQCKLNMQRASDRAEEEKQQFRKFCETMQDPKMRKTAIDGVENRKSYAEILEHQQLLEQRILGAIQLAEATIQDYDKEQQQVITYINRHLKRVRDDLVDIPKKTRVKVGDDSKYLFQIQVPDWDEETGKEKVRDYLEWIIDNIDQAKYKDEYGNEDTVEVRKYLEKHLQTVPILREVLGNQVMKVSCRKVESERHVSSHFYSWEQSNQWSGGEKWSKNMALYLGLLRFIAEKTGRVESNTKRQRTVILDNPFGKASSDHVLSPVFYIAEQLGFQILSLTAHAEGKFLGDYFPVIYSCRLRSVQGDAHQVVTKEQLLQKAYFKDNDPERLAYLGEREQLTLF